MKHFYLFFLIPFFSFGDTQFSETDIRFFPVKKATNSLVRVVIEHSQNRLITDAKKESPHRFETIGFIAEDRQGDIGIITGFNIFNAAVHRNAQKALMVYNSTGRKFAVKGVKSTSSNNLIFFTLKGDVTENGRLSPLPIAHSEINDEPKFYTTKVVSGDIYHLKTKKVQKTISLENRMDFLTSDTYTKTIQPTKTHTPIVNQTPVFNQKGEVVSFVVDGSEHLLYGIPLQNLKTLLSSSEYCSPFIRGCVIEERRKLREKALQDKSRRAAYALVFLTYELDKSFKDFMESIGIQDSVQIAKEETFFWKEATKWDPELYYHWLINNKNLSISDRKKHLEFLKQESSLRSLAQQGHPHYQHLLSDIYFQLDDRSQALYWLNKARQSGYIPAIWKTMSLLYFIESFNSLNRLAKQGYPPAQQLLGLVNQDFKKFKGSLNRYSRRKLKRPDLPNQEQPQTDSNKPLDVSQQRSTSSLTKPNVYHLSKHFADTLVNLQKGFAILETLLRQNHRRAKEVLTSFERHEVPKKLRLLFYPISEPLNKKCEEVFDEHFISLEN